MFLGKSYFPQCKLKVLLLCCHQFAQCDHKFFYLATFHFIIIDTFLSYSTFAKGEVREAIFFRKPTSISLTFRVFSKTHQSSLTLKGGSTSHLGLLPSGKKRKPLLLVALNRFAIWMADHQRSTPAAELRFFCAGMNPLSLKDLPRTSAPSGVLVE